jgi:hypothetical protein
LDLKRQVSYSTRAGSDGRIKVFLRAIPHRSHLPVIYREVRRPQKWMGKDVRGNKSRRLRRIVWNALRPGLIGRNLYKVTADQTDQKPREEHIQLIDLLCNTTLRPCEAAHWQVAGSPFTRLPTSMRTCMHPISIRDWLGRNGTGTNEKRQRRNRHFLGA